MKTIFIDYPTKLAFRTIKTFTNNDERTKYLHYVLRKNKVNSPCHGYNEYVIEMVEPFLHGEIWILGS